MDQHCFCFYSVEPPTFEFELLSKRIASLLKADLSLKIDEETCYYIITKSAEAAKALSEDDDGHLKWLLSSDVFVPNLTPQSSFSPSDFVVEIGPHLHIETPFSTNAVAAFESAGFHDILRIERARRYRLLHSSVIAHYSKDDLINLFGDKLTECVYDEDVKDKFLEHKPMGESYFTIDLTGEDSIHKLNLVNEQFGLGFDSADKAYYLDLFQKMGRSPTDVELFDLAQSNSEHCRHWFFRGKIFINEEARKESLFESVQNTQKYSNKNNVIAFCDNSSGIYGFKTPGLISTDASTASQLKVKHLLRHIIYTAETHNFPTGVCPFPGAATGTGGRLRDVHSTGRGAHEVAGLVGYSVGNLHLEDYPLEGEDANEKQPSHLASAQRILIEASNGASDYGNKFGEPVIGGYCRSFGLRMPHSQKRIEYLKPILFSGGVGLIDDKFVHKQPCKKGQLVTKIGGPAYRIGVGGGAASSIDVQGNRVVNLDYLAVQRGDPEMEQKLHRFVRACIELEDRNPILSIHDQGAGGNGNVIKELVEDAGAIIHADKFDLGDPTLSIRELWGAEYQESDAVLLDSKLKELAIDIGVREKCPVTIVGTATDNGRVIVKNFSKAETKQDNDPVDLDLRMLAERSQKEFHFAVPKLEHQELVLPKDLNLRSALESVLRLPSVGSKRFLTNKVDRSVTGLVVQQQCVGPLHTPLADVSVTAHSYWSTVGSAMALGEQPIKGLVDPVCGAQMSVAEALTNLVFAPITELADVKCSGNWMWPAKLDDEGGLLVMTCDAMCEFMQKLGIAVDGGKDSLSMATYCEKEVVKAPGTLVVTAYAPCTDIRRVVTPNLKADTKPTTLLYIHMNSFSEHWRLGGSALAQCLRQVGAHAPRIDDPAYFRRCFVQIQRWVHFGLVLSGHDVSDGGLLVAALEMAFAGNRSLHFNIEADETKTPLEIAFAEESGVLLEVEERYVIDVLKDCVNHGLHVKTVGHSFPAYGPNSMVHVVINGTEYINESLHDLREIWEETSDHLELLQTFEPCVKEQIEWRKSVTTINYHANFDYGIPPVVCKVVPKVAILREEGSNGDRELAAAFMMAGFEAYDVTMSDLSYGQTHLDDFKGIAFVGGFSFGDALGAAKGWASAILFEKRMREMFKKFHDRKDSFSLGVCNGCQLMTLLGWVGNADQTKDTSCNVFMGKNKCGRYHSGFSTIRIEKTPAIMLKGMENSVLGAWSSHGEGMFTYRSPNVLSELKSKSLICFRYTDGQGYPTQLYPANPNGSEDAVAGICSADGRHLCLMPHPERSFLQFQWPDIPHAWTVAKKQNYVSPWIRMFENAYEWSTECRE